MRRKIEISYNWWNDDGTDIPIEHLGVLEEHAEERINEMRKEGYTEGELCCVVYDENDNEIEYRGWWELSYVSAEETV